VYVHLGSFQAFDIATDLKQSKLSNDSHFLLTQSISQLTSSSSQQKLFKVKFETNSIRSILGLPC
ncbi:unnamed protein product, partial [Rotaria sp. Silwood1]